MRITSKMSPKRMSHVVADSQAGKPNVMEYSERPSVKHPNGRSETWYRTRCGKLIVAERARASVETDIECRRCPLAEQ